MLDRYTMVQDGLSVAALHVSSRHTVALGTTFRAHSLASPLHWSTTNRFAVVQTQLVTTFNIAMHIVNGLG